MWQGYAQISLKLALVNLIQELFNGGGVYFDLTHESKKNKIHTTTSPKGQCLMESALHSVHTWDCLRCRYG